jgi:heme oxygenase (biliverdin-IX-beta and delta-forming)
MKGCLDNAVRGISRLSFFSRIPMSEFFVEATPPPIPADHGGTVASAGRASGVVRRALRIATLAEHETLDARLSRLDLNGTQDYRLFLSGHLAALEYLQAYWRPADERDFALMLRCVRTDLDSLGFTKPASPGAAHKPGSLSRGLGISYVIRGSRLGATLLRRHITKVSLPTSYLDFAPALSWSQFLKQLESMAGDSRAIDQAGLCARKTFFTFARSFDRLRSEFARPLP